MPRLVLSSALALGMTFVRAPSDEPWIQQISANETLVRTASDELVLDAEVDGTRVMLESIAQAEPRVVWLVLRRSCASSERPRWVEKTAVRVEIDGEAVGLLAKAHDFHPYAGDSCPGYVETMEVKLPLGAVRSMARSRSARLTVGKDRIDLTGALHARLPPFLRKLEALAPRK